MSIHSPSGARFLKSMIPGAIFALSLGLGTSAATPPGETTPRMMSLLLPLPPPLPPLKLPDLPLPPPPLFPPIIV